MTLILQNIGKLFEPKFKNLDAKLWVQRCKTLGTKSNFKKIF